MSDQSYTETPEEKARIANEVRELLHGASAASSVTWAARREVASLESQLAEERRANVIAVQEHVHRANRAEIRAQDAEAHAESLRFALYDLAESVNLALGAMMAGSVAGDSLRGFLQKSHERAGELLANATPSSAGERVRRLEEADSLWNDVEKRGLSIVCDTYAGGPVWAAYVVYPEKPDSAKSPLRMFATPRQAAVAALSALDAPPAKQPKEG